MSAVVEVEPEPVPLVRDEAGRWMIAGTRIPLDTLVVCFERGESPEEIHEGFPSLSLGDIYAVLTYCIRHRGSVSAYLARQEVKAAEVRSAIEARFPPEGLRAKLLGRLEA